MSQAFTSPSAPSPLVSVVMASYNHAAFVREAIDSVRAQTLGHWELVVTDDGSSDGTADIVREMAAGDPRIRFHGFSANQGACIALNDAIARARGDLIAVLNSDDRWLPEKLAHQVDFLQRNPSIAAVFALPQLIDERGDLLPDDPLGYQRLFHVENRSRGEWLDHFFRQGNCLCHQSILIRRSCYQLIGGYDPRLAQLPDLDMWVRLCAVAEIYVLHEPLVEFRILEGQRNASGPRPEVLAREAWERLHVLRQYLALDLCEHVAATPAPDYPASANLDSGPVIRVAWTALALGTPAHRALAVEILHQALKPDSPRVQGLPSHREYIRLTGETDVFWQGSLALCHQLQEELAQLRQRVSADAEERARSAADAEDFRQRFAALEAALRHARERTEALEASTSWRLTAPLRHVARLFTGRAKGRSQPHL